MAVEVAHRRPGGHPRRRHRAHGPPSGPGLVAEPRLAAAGQVRHRHAARRRHARPDRLRQLAQDRAEGLPAALQHAADCSQHRERQQGQERADHRAHGARPLPGGLRAQLRGHRLAERHRPRKPADDGDRRVPRPARHRPRHGAPVQGGRGRLLRARPGRGSVQRALAQLHRLPAGPGTEARGQFAKGPRPSCSSRLLLESALPAPTPRPRCPRATWPPPTPASTWRWPTRPTSTRSSRPA